MLDSLIPAYEACKISVESNKSILEIFEITAQKAEEVTIFLFYIIN